MHVLRRHPFVSRSITTVALERSSAARAAINAAWKAQTKPVAPITAALSGNEVNRREPDAERLIDEFKLADSCPRDDDITLALGESFDRLLLLLVPFNSVRTGEYLERLLAKAAASGHELSIRTVQHLFARVNNYPEALAIFHAMRKSNVRMNTHAYYAMTFCLQRLEEESWALRHRQKLSETDELSPEAIQFILDGPPGQLMPENKPWLGRVVFADVDPESTVKNGPRSDFDALGRQFHERYSN